MVSSFFGGLVGFVGLLVRRFIVLLGSSVYGVRRFVGCASSLGSPVCWVRPSVRFVSFLGVVDFVDLLVHRFVEFVHLLGTLVGLLDSSACWADRGGSVC